MTLPVSGAISFNNINVELGVAGTTQASLGQSSYRTLAGVPSGAISMSNFYGKANAFAFSISSSQNKANLRSLAVAAGWNQSTAVVATLNSGVYIWSDSISTAALTIDGSWPGGLTFVNNGYIMGMGGTGGSAPYVATANTTISNTGQTAGGPAIALGVSCTIQNNSYIGGGGGGGGGGTSVGSNAFYNYNQTTGGGGAGGGNAGSASGVSTTVPGASGGGIGSSGADGDNTSYFGIMAGGGGRIMPGSRVTTPTAVYADGSSTAGYGGEGGVNGGPISSTLTTSATSGNNYYVGLGGSAGGSGAAFAGRGIYGPIGYTGGGGGGWGASGGPARVRQNSVSYGNVDATFTGASAGKCVNLNGYSITWSATGTRWGGIS